MHAHFRTYSSGDWDVHWGFGILTHRRSALTPDLAARVQRLAECKIFCFWCKNGQHLRFPLFKHDGLEQPKNRCYPPTFKQTALCISEIATCKASFQEVPAVSCQAPAFAPFCTYFQLIKSTVRSHGSGEKKMRKKTRTDPLPCVEELEKCVAETAQ